ncbi:MAG TPA: c-type cytochrome [Candidatus Dormibacteraeota bacterium]|nr:c-type cytochrome [Candidatus Dormibacteraeota bacterium]
MRRPRNKIPRPALLILLAAVALVPACRDRRPSSPAAALPGAPGDPDTVLATDRERSGEAVYRRENCARCHTLFDRPRADGGLDLPRGADVEDSGSRVGPDLGLEGHRRSDDWHYAHLYAPDAVVRGSRMPASRHLFRPQGGLPVPIGEAADLVAYLQALGRARRDVWAEWRRREPDIPAPPVVDEDLLRRGTGLYGRHCAACHGEAGDGRGAIAALFIFPPRDFTSAQFRFKSTPLGRPPADADLFRTITLGTGIGSAMPAFYDLDGRDRWALVLAVKRFSRSLRGCVLEAAAPAGHRRAPGAEDAERAAQESEGRRLWGSLGCASCHGQAGAGLSREEARAGWVDGAGVRVPRSGNLTHACALRAGASAEAIGRSVLSGVGAAMPSYADALPDERSRRALLGYVLSLSEPPTSPRTPGRP